MVLSWVGIYGFKCVVDEHQTPLDPKHRVMAWNVLVVQLDPADAEFELSLRIDGFGFEHTSRTPGFCVTETWGGTGLWHVDQLVKSNLLVSWAGSDFKSLTVWLPSFAAAVVELWPSTAEEHLRAWLSVPATSLYAIVLEHWGWNLIKISLAPHASNITFFEPESEVSASAAFLAFRVHAASGRKWSSETKLDRGNEYGAPGTLERIFVLLDSELDLPHHVATALQHRRKLALSESHESSSATCSPTLPYGFSPSQLPKTATVPGVSDFDIGLYCQVFAGLFQGLDLQPNFGFWGRTYQGSDVGFGLWF